MDVLWAPWRMTYVGATPGPRGCLFCEVGRGEDDTTHGVLVRSARSLLMLNAYPYSTGHLMAAPLRHLASLEDLEPEEQVELVRLVERGLVALRQVYRPDGFNLGANIGRVAGAGVEGHLHLHVVPRWQGDTNFMPVVGGAKVLPESLDETFRRLRVQLAT